LAARFEPDEVQDVLGRLERVGLVDDRAFARQFAEHQYENRLAGRRAVTSGLLAKGVSPAVAAAVAGEADREVELERADRLARSAAARMTGVDPTKAFGRLTGMLLRRGHEPEVARAAARRALRVEASED
jgi:regulatory protein